MPPELVKKLPKDSAKFDPDLELGKGLFLLSFVFYFFGELVLLLIRITNYCALYFYAVLYPRISNHFMDIKSFIHGHSLSKMWQVLLAL